MEVPVEDEEEERGTGQVQGDFGGLRFWRMAWLRCMLVVRLVCLCTGTVVGISG